LNFETDRASVRRWALENHRAPDTRYKSVPKPVKRWQARDLGALWQYDASPHAWLPGNPDKQALLDLLDDATRYNTGARLYPSETLLAHFDFLPRAFQAHGLPLALYVDLALAAEMVMCPLAWSTSDHSRRSISAERKPANAPRPGRAGSWTRQRFDSRRLLPKPGRGTAGAAPISSKWVLPKHEHPYE